MFYKAYFTTSNDEPVWMPVDFTNLERAKRAVKSNLAGGTGFGGVDIYMPDIDGNHAHVATIAIDPVDRGRFEEHYHVLGRQLAT